MEFESLVSSSKAVLELNKRLGFNKVRRTNRKSDAQIAISNLQKACRSGRAVLKKIKTVVEDPEIISDYVASVGRFIAISEKIINKLEVK